MQADSPCHGMSVPAAVRAPLFPASLWKAVLGHGDLLIFFVWKRKYVLALMSVEKFCDGVHVNFK